MHSSLAPHASGAATTTRAIERAAFKQLNRIMVPVLRMGLARFMGSPLTGYFLLLHTTGRKADLPRLAPLNYAVDGGCVCVLAGFGEGTDWLANICADPRVGVWLPDREFEGSAEVVDDPQEAGRLATAVARNSGVAIAFEDPRCLFMSDVDLASILEERPVVRIRPDGPPIVPGPYDPGGRGWLLTVGGQVVALAGVWAFVRRRFAKR